jgi:hypothetical protein
MKTTLTLSPVDRGRREPDPAPASLTYIFIPYQAPPKPHLNIFALFGALGGSGLIVALFAGVGWGAHWLLQKVWDWL